MAFPGGVTKVVFSGTMAGGEVWSSGFYATLPNASITAQSYADTFASQGYIATLMAAHRTLNNPGCVWNRVTVYLYRAGSAATDVGSAAITDTSGSFSSVYHPTSVACTLVLRTAIANRTGRGRMFWPATGVVMTANGTMQTADVQALVSAMGFIVKQSLGQVVSSKQGVVRPVTSVTADTRPDTIRARYDKIKGSQLRYAF